MPDIGAFEKSYDVKLGPEGSETTLPKLEWLGGSPPSWSVSSNKQMEEAVMSDKSRRYAFFGVKQEFGIGLAYLNKMWLDRMRALNALNQVLRFQNNNDDSIWHEVVIVSFRDEPERMDIRQLERYKVEMTLREA